MSAPLPNKPGHDFKNNAVRNDGVSQEWNEMWGHIARAKQPEEFMDAGPQSQPPDAVAWRNQKMEHWLFDRQPPHLSGLRVNQGSGGAPSMIRRGGSYQPTDLTPESLRALNDEWSRCRAIMAETVSCWAPRFATVEACREWYGGEGRTKLSDEALKLFGVAYGLAKTGRKDLLEAGQLMELPAPPAAPVEAKDSDPVRVIFRPHVPDDAPRSVVEAPAEPKIGEILGRIESANKRKQKAAKMAEEKI